MNFSDSIKKHWNQLSDSIKNWNGLSVSREISFKWRMIGWSKNWLRNIKNWLEWLLWVLIINYFKLIIWYNDKFCGMVSLFLIMLRVAGKELSASIKHCFDKYSDNIKSTWNELSDNMRNL